MLLVLIPKPATVPSPNPSLTPAGTSGITLSAASPGSLTLTAAASGSLTLTPVA